MNQRTHLHLILTVLRPSIDDRMCLLHKQSRFKLTQLVLIHFLQQISGQELWVVDFRQQVLYLLLKYEIQALRLGVACRRQERTVVLNRFKDLYSVYDQFIVR